MIFSTYILSLFGYDFTTMFSSKLKSLLNRMSLIGIEGKVVLNTKEELGDIAVSEEINVKDKFFETAFKSENFFYDNGSLRPANPEVSNYLKGKKGSASEVLFGNNTFFSLELTHNVRYIRSYPFLFHEALYALGMSYHHSLSLTDKMVRMSESRSSLLVQSGGNCVSVDRNAKLEKKALFILSNILGIKYTGSIVDVAPILSSIFDVVVTFKDSKDRYDFFCSSPLFPLIYSFMLVYLFVAPAKNTNSKVNWWEKFFNYISLSTAVTIRLSALSSITGIKLNLPKILLALERYGIGSELMLNSGTLMLSFPKFKNISNAEDALEEIVRILFPILFRYPYKVLSTEHNTVRNALGLFHSLGFRSIKSQPFVDYGEVELENPLKKGKEYMRCDMLYSLLSAHRKINSDRLMEIGTVFHSHENRHYSFKSLALMQQCSETTRLVW